jgi:hemerythrin-like metal-binding protein
LAAFECIDHHDLGVPILDVQLRELVAAAARLYRVAMEGPGPEGSKAEVEALVATARFHFAMEERMMERRNYEDLELHVKQHGRFSEMLDDFQEYASAGQVGRAKDVITEMENWLRNHISKSDQEFADLIREQRVA